jgi:hypothetical protein
VGIEVVLFALLGHRIATEGNEVLEGRPSVPRLEDRVVDAVLFHPVFSYIELQIDFAAVGK